MQQYTVDALSARRIILDPNRIDGYTSEPARRHRKKRIQKKWLKATVTSRSRTRIFIFLRTARSLCTRQSSGIL